jgi:hypothetical protein
MEKDLSLETREFEHVFGFAGFRIDFGEDVFENNEDLGNSRFVRMGIGDSIYDRF